MNLPLAQSDSVSLEDHHEQSRLAQRRADKWMIVGALLMGMWIPGLIGFPIFMRGSAGERRRTTLNSPASVVRLRSAETIVTGAGESAVFGSFSAPKTGIRKTSVRNNLTAESEI